MLGLVLDGTFLINQLCSCLFCSVPVKGGGIIDSDKYKSYVVNIRPTKWLERFWIGKIDRYVDAQFIADAVFHYTGHPSFHFKDANFKFPPLECSDRGISTFLTDRDMCSKYTSSIAKGNDFKTQRSDFMKKVKTLALEELKSPGVQSVLRQFRHKSSSAESPVEKDAGNDVEGVVENDVEGAAGNDVEGVAGYDVDGIDADHSTPMEVDDLSRQATNFSRLVTSCCDGPEAVDQDLEGRNGLVPSFDISGPGFTLQSDFTPVELSWTEDYLDSLNFSDLEDLHESFKNGKQ